MAGKITIEKINFPVTPNSTQTLTVEYKLASQPESSYVTFLSSMVVGTDGVPTASPLPQITGLSSGQLYNIRFTQHCGSPVPYWIENITVL